MSDKGKTGAATPAGEGAAPEVKTDPTPEPGKGQAPAATTITVGDKVFKAEDVQGILDAKSGLEKSQKELQTKLDAIEKSKLSELEKAQKERDDALADTAKANKRLIDSEVQRLLDKAKIPLKAADLNLGIETIDDVEAKAQKFIDDHPTLAGKADEGGETTKEGAPGSPAAASPAAPARSTDKEKELKAAFENAKTTGELATAEKAWREYTGKEGPAARTVL